MTRYADAFLDAATSAASLLADASVAQHWDQLSALPQFTVRGLAGHLASQVLNVVRVLGAPTPPGIETVTLEQHYGRVLWRGADVDADVNVGIRRGGEELAGRGPAGLVTETYTAIEELRATLPATDGRRPVLLPWAGWALSVDDFLTTRMLEIVVHSDDVAVSVGIETPQLPVRVMHPVFDLLFVLALRRHGQVAVLRALSRAERAPASIAAI
ncbi:MAG TPA: maleylpyruvate isomerase N-terminal domain-containing protein [Micromonosporaceae bacterium]